MRMKKTLKEWSEDIHKLAVSKGWWEEDRVSSEIMALIHSEISEAVEEYRAGKGLAYVIGEDGQEIDIKDADIKKIEGLKPEGICIELIDAVIRILDYMGRVGYGDKFMRPVKRGNVSFLVFAAGLHRLVAEDDVSSLRVCIGDIFGWVIKQGYEPERLMEIKYKFNEMRPYKHNKLC